MSIQQTKKQSDLEKRLTLLRRQVYGKQGFKIENQAMVGTQTKRTISTDSTYLYQDLLKICILASLALGSQIVIFILIKNNILNLKLF